MDADETRRLNATIIEHYRAGDQDLGVPGTHRDRLVLLTTTGRRTGERHTAPMLFLPWEDGILVVASNDGAPTPPQWYRNLESDPNAFVELPEEEWDADARTLGGAEREHAWSRLIERYPMFDEHEQQAGREIPLVALSHRASPADAG